MKAPNCVGPRFRPRKARPSHCPASATGCRAETLSYTRHKQRIMPQKRQPDSIGARDRAMHSLTQKTKKIIRIKIMRPAAALVVLALAGCATGNSSKNEPQLAGPVAPPTVAPSLPSPAAKAAAAPNATVDSSGRLPCETQSCKINCSPKVAPRFRPKWCAQFEEPIE